MMKKSSIIIWVICIILGILSVGFATNYEYNKYKNEYNEMVYGLIGRIKEKYPDVTDEEIASLLNGEENVEEDVKDLLEKYGIQENDTAILNLESIYTESIILNCSIIAILAILMITFFLIYKYKKKRELGNITKYIQQINNKNYELKIKENTEDELTNLRNELYKITLMLKEQAENSEKDKRNLATSLSDISHQIKTPLTSMTIMLDEIKDNTNMDESTKQKFLFEISRQVEKINFLTISLLKLSKLDAEAVKFNKQKIKMDDIVNNMIENLEIPIEIKKQNIVKSIDGECYIIADYNWTLEAITNILKNCVEHTMEEKNIYIKAKNTNMYTELEIRDEGEGIEEEDLKHIFERFYKGKNSGENSFGIGLALAKAILENQKASINCYSVKGEGTTFKIRWMK